jgi:hypothetical protein
MPSLKSIVYGLICAIIIILMGIVITPFISVDKSVTALGSLAGLIVPPLVEKLAEKKTSTIDESIKNLAIRISELETEINNIENDVISITSILSCYPLSQIQDEIHEIETEIKIIKATTKE